MKIIAAVVVGVAILAISFGLYRWTSGDEHRDRAEAAANEFTTYFSRAARAKCEASDLEPLADGQWRFRFSCRNGSQVANTSVDGRCMALDLERFRATQNDSLYVGGYVEGVEDTRCSADSWTAQEAAQRLVESSWARERKARFFSCYGGPKRFALYRKRFGCRYSTPRGDGYVVIHTTGPETFEIERSP